MGISPEAGPATGLANDPAQVVASAWRDQALWSAVATQIGDSIKRWRFIAAAAGVLGLFLTVLAGTLTADGPGGGKRTLLTTAGVLLLALVPFLRQQLLSPERLQRWTRARNVSEQLKEAIFRHLMGVLAPEPLADGTPAPNADGAANLVRRCRNIKQATAELAGLAAAAQPGGRERKTRLTLDDYLKERVDGQIGYYRKSGEQAGIAARRLQAAEFTLGLLAVVLGALSGQTVPPEVDGEVVKSAFSMTTLVPWLALVASASTAVTAHIAGARHVELAAKYFATYDLLKTLRDEWSVSPDPRAPAQVRAFVDAVERAIASEYGGWVADWAKAQQKAPQA